MNLSDRIANWVGRLDALHTAALRRWYGASASRQRWRIEAYRGFGTPHEAFVRGRVLRPVEHVPADAAHPAWRNLVEFFKRMESDEFPGAPVRIALGGATVEAVANDEGHFDVRIAPAAPLAGGWHEATVELAGDAAPPVSSGAPVLVPFASARFAVVSDLDDTVVWSNVKRKLRMLAMLARSNARTRKPFEGVGAFYRALHAGVAGDERNPLFYVSNSPWNLHAPLAEFLDLHGLPRGPLMLRDFGDHLLLRRDDRHDKLDAIERVLSTYPALPVVLIGDSGERDPELYAQVVDAHPGRVLAIYIRSVDADPARHREVRALAERTRAAGIDLVLALDSQAAAEHAARTGLIAPEALHAIRGECRAEQAAVEAT